MSMFGQVAANQYMSQVSSWSEIVCLVYNYVWSCRSFARQPLPEGVDALISEMTTLAALD